VLFVLIAIRVNPRKSVARGYRYNHQFPGDPSLPFDDLRQWIAALDRAGELKRIQTEVDPILESQK